MFRLTPTLSFRLNCNLNVSSFIDKLVGPIVSLQFHKW